LRPWSADRAGLSAGHAAVKSSILAAAALAVLFVAWAATNLAAGGQGFAVLVSDTLHGSEEAASALARLFAALVLGLFLADEAGWRTRWVADSRCWAWDISSSDIWSQSRRVIRPS
jgi:hypothetical protein